MLCGFTPRSISTVTKRHPGKLQNILFTSFLLPIQKVCQTNQSSRTQQLSALWNGGFPQALGPTSEVLAEGGSRAPSLQLLSRGCNLAVILPPSHNCCQRGKLPGTPRPPSSAVAASHAAPSRAQGTAGRTSSILAEGKAARQRGQLPVAVRGPLG